MKLVPQANKIVNNVYILLALNTLSLIQNQDEEQQSKDGLETSINTSLRRHQNLIRVTIK